MGSSPPPGAETRNSVPVRVRELRYLLLARPAARRILASSFGPAQADLMLRPLNWAIEAARQRLVRRKGGRKRYLKEMLADCPCKGVPVELLFHDGAVELKATQSLVDQILSQEETRDCWAQAVRIGETVIYL